MKFQNYAAELIGAFFLTFAVSVSILFDLPVPTPVIAGLTLGLFVYTVGSVSGAHLNPAVTIALLSARKIELKDAIIYVIAQILGGFLAMLLIKGLNGSGVEVVVENQWRVVLAEAMGTFILVFGVSAVVWEKVHAGASGLTIGSSLLLGILLSSGWSAGILNPAVAIGIGAISSIYLLAPVLGGLAGVWVFLRLNKQQSWFDKWRK